MPDLPAVAEAGSAAGSVAAARSRASRRRGRARRLRVFSGGCFFCAVAAEFAYLRAANADALLHDDPV